LNTERPYRADDPHEEAAYWAMQLTGETPSAAERQRFEAWLNADARNIERMEDILTSWEAVEAHAAADPILELRQAALSSARWSAAERNRGWHGIGWRAALAAASLLLAVMGGAVWFMLQPTQYRTGVGERRVVTLDDGSSVSLDAGTTVDVAYSRNARDLWVEQGRAQFAVVKDPLRPFSVHAGSKLVVATGTVFSVERLLGAVHVILYQGHVALFDATTQNYRPIAVREPARKHTQTLLSPDQQVTLADADHASNQPVVSAAPVDPVLSLDWQRGQMTFSDAPLPVVVQRMNRYAALPLRIGDEEARDIRVSGVFRAGDIEALIQGLEAAFHVHVSEEPNAIAVYGGKRPTA
jgi:transmembrane sensor